MAKEARRATIIDIARDAGLSKSTVSLVLKNSALVRSETRDRVERSMSKLGYVYNRAAAGLRNATSALVGMVVADLANPFFSELSASIEQALDAEGYVPILANTGESLARQAKVLRTLREHGVAGILLTPAHETQPRDIAACLPESIPVVTMMRRVDGGQLAYVGPDNVAGSQDAVAHLIGLGHRRIAFLGGAAGTATQNERLAGFKAALAAAGLPFDAALVFSGPSTRSGGAAQAEEALAIPEPPTALFCYNDIVAIGALATLSRRGIAAGRDIAVIGFDDILEARHCYPALTSVSADTAALGRQAAQGLARLIQGAASEEATFIGATSLIVRESCGATRHHLETVR